MKLHPARAPAGVGMRVRLHANLGVLTWLAADFGPIGWLRLSRISRLIDLQESFCSAGGGAVCARIQFETSSMRGQQETKTMAIRWISVARERLIPPGCRPGVPGTSRKAES